MWIRLPRRGRRGRQRIADESALHNLGPTVNINTPTFPLQMFEVTFRPTTGDAVLVPERAWEWSLGGSPLSGDVGLVEGQASYTNLRRFNVNTEERLR